VFAESTNVVGIFFLHRNMEKTTDQLQAECFAQLLDKFLRDVLLEQGSIGTSIFRRSELQAMIDDHIAGKRNWLEVIGIMTIMENYRHMVRQTRAMVRQMT